MISVDTFNIQKGAEFFLLSLYPGITMNNISGFQSEFTNLRGRNVNVMISGKIIFTADKSISVRHNFQNSMSADSAVQLRIVNLNPINSNNPGRSALCLPGLHSPFFRWLPSFLRSLYSPFFRWLSSFLRSLQSLFFGRLNPAFFRRLLFPFFGTPRFPFPDSLHFFILFLLLSSAL